MSAAAAAFADGRVMRYHDARFKTEAAKLLPTQYLVVDNDTALVTVLGSCVAACIRDPLLKLGGMNHFLLPDGNVGDGAPARAVERDCIFHGAIISVAKHRFLDRG